MTNENKIFYNLAKQCNKERTQEQKIFESNVEYMIKCEYAKFCIWCRAFKNSKFTLENFNQYIKENKIDKNIIENINLKYFAKE